VVTRISSECRELIDYQQGVVARWQAADCASDQHAFASLLRADRWQTMYRGVYAAQTGAPSRESTLWAAVLRCGPTAALSHFTAAELDGLTDRPSEAIHVAIPGQVRVWFSADEFSRGLPRIVLHRSARLSSAKHPARTPPRTRTEETVLDLVELAPTFGAAFGWLSAGCGRRLVTPAHLRAAAERRTKMRWRADVMTALGELVDGVLSNLERGYVRRVESPHRLPRAKRQVRLRQGLRSAYLDILYDDFGLALELDGLAAHPAESRWLDMRRDNYFAGTGIITMRYCWADITDRPCEVAGEVARVLRQRGWTGTLRSCGPNCRATFRDHG
jgi:very-short-patch-repair endonuclease